MASFQVFWSCSLSMHNESKYGDKKRDPGPLLLKYAKNRVFRKQSHLRNLDCLKTRLNLEYSSSASNGHALYAKGIKLRSLTMLRFCPCCLEFLWGDVCWTLSGAFQVQPRFRNS